MKRIILCFVVFTALAHLGLVSCSLMGDVDGNQVKEGELRISFASDCTMSTRASETLPDTSDFILKVTDSEGNIMYNGRYGDSPESMMVKPGSYWVSVISSEFSRPAFSSPQYGDEQCVMVPSGGVADVKLVCSQINCGIRLDIDPGFLVSCPDGVLFLKSAQGRLMYGYSEKRIAYFLPGSISLILNQDEREEVLMTRTLCAQEILTIDVNVASDTGSQESSISVSVDTSRTWLSDSFVIGGDNGKGSGSAEALTVTQARSSVGREDVWVSGYIVGGDLTSSSASYDNPFKSRTCILLGSRSSVADRSSCLSVQLPAGDVRDAINLVDNPHLLGKKVAVKGNIVASYYGLVGLKDCDDWEL